MQINLTLLGEMITFVVFIFLTLRFVWPPILKALEERRHNIEVGLKAAADGKISLQEANRKAEDIIRNAKTRADALIEKGKEEGNRIIAQAKAVAKIEKDRIVNAAEDQIAQKNLESLRDLGQIGLELARSMAKRLLEQSIGEEIQEKILRNAVKKIGEK